MGDIKRHTKWKDFAIELFERSKERNAKINYHFDQFEINVPDHHKEDSPSALWKLNGTLSITTPETL